MLYKCVCISLVNDFLWRQLLLSMCDNAAGIVRCETTIDRSIMIPDHLNQTLLFLVVTWLRAKVSAV